MKCVVTGGAGFIGSHLCDALVEQGADVLALDDLSTGSRQNLEGAGVELVEGSILNHDLLTSVVAGADAVVHLAALPSVSRSVTDPLSSHEVNATGTLRVLEAVRSSAPLAHVTVASSSSVYGGNKALPKSEELTLQPLSPYAVSKAAAEAYVSAFTACYGLSAVAFRFFNVYGPRQLPGHAYAAVIPAFLHAHLRGEVAQIHGDGTQTRDFTYVSTVVEAIVAGITRRVSASATNLAHGSRTSLLGLLAEIEEVSGRPVARRHVASRTGDVRDSQADGSKFASLFPEVRPTPLREGLASTTQWMQRFVARPSESWPGA